MGSIYLLASALGSSACAQSDWESEREALAREVEEDVRLTSSYTGKLFLDPQVMNAIRTVARHEFVPEGDRQYA